MDAVDKIVAEVLRRLDREHGGTGNVENTRDASAGKAADSGIPVEMSARHVHLTPADLKALFGAEELAVSRAISQPGQYLSALRVRLIGPKGSIDGAAVLGPARDKTQVEISATDARALGIKAPVRLSGDLAGAAAVYIQAGESMLRREAAIVAKRHLHMLPSDALRFGVRDGQSVSVRVAGSRPLIFEDVPVRVTDNSALALHIDTDEANACGLAKDGKCEIVGAAGIIADSCADDRKTGGSSGAGTELRIARVFEGKLLTDADVRAFYKDGARELALNKRQLVTPLARDTAKEMGLRLIVEESR